MKFYWSTLSDSRMKKLSDICSDSGIVFIASVVLPEIFGKFDIVLFVSGSASAVTCLLVSFALCK